MFNIGLGEIMFIAVLALIVLGPERLPKVMRQVGTAVAQLRKITAELNAQFSDELKPLGEIRGLADDLRNPIRQIGSMMDPTTKPPPKSDHTSAPNPPQATPANNLFLQSQNPMAIIGGAVAKPKAISSETESSGEANNPDTLAESTVPSESGSIQGEADDL